MYYSKLENRFQTRQLCPKLVQLKGISRLKIYKCIIKYIYMYMEIKTIGWAEQAKIWKNVCHAVTTSQVVSHICLIYYSVILRDAWRQNLEICVFESKTIVLVCFCNHFVSLRTCLTLFYFNIMDSFGTYHA